MLILSTRLGAFLHEFIGHGLMAVLLGGRFEAFRLTLFAGGRAEFAGNFGGVASMLVGFGGIGINVLTGLLIFLFIRKRKTSFAMAIFGIFFAGVSILSQIQYLILGSYYEYGDPVCLGCYPVAKTIVWMVGLGVLTYFSWLLMQHFFRFQDANFPVDHLLNRAMITFLILGIPILIYAGLYNGSKTSLGSMAAIQEARLRSLNEAERIKAETRSEESIEDIRERIEPFPILPVILAIYFITTLFAFSNTHGKTSKQYFPSIPLSLVDCIPWVVLSGFVLAFIAMIW